MVSFLVLFSSPKEKSMYKEKTSKEKKMVVNFDRDTLINA